jgi:hypothetical protein
MIQAAGLGCELCQFFLECAEGLPQNELEAMQNGGQLYLRGTSDGECHIDNEVSRLLYLEASLLSFYCFAPDLSRPYPLPMQMTAAKIAQRFPT